MIGKPFVGHKEGDEVELKTLDRDGMPITKKVKIISISENTVIYKEVKE